jgi:hypothetical protein
LLIEYVKVDYDGDGISERRAIHRVGSKVLNNEECSHVPVSICSPYLKPHRWVGESPWDKLHEIQQFRSGIMREMSDSFHLANSPRTAVSTDGNWNPNVLLDDLLSQQIGGTIRVKGDVNANLREIKSSWIGMDGMPFLELASAIKEERIGITRHNQGLDADSLNKTATGKVIDMTAGQRRTKLIARVIAETLFVPMCKGVLKLLTEGNMPRIAAKIRGKFVDMDPSGWTNEFDMSLSVGLGTGDKQQQAMTLQSILANQMAFLGHPMTADLVNKRVLYRTVAKQAEAGGFQQPETLYVDPESPEGQQIEQAKAQQPPPPPPPEIMREQMRGQSAEKIKAMEMQADQARLQAEAQRQQLMQQAAEQSDAIRRRHEGAITAAKMMQDEEQAALDRELKIRLAAIDAQNKRVLENQDAENQVALKYVQADIDSRQTEQENAQSDSENDDQPAIQRQRGR